MAVQYPKKLNLARLQTPLQPLLRLSESLKGPRIWVKRDDLTGCAESGNKIRKLEFTLAAALESGADTIITCGGVQSNHCRATALLCAQLGLKCRLILRGDSPHALEANTLLDRVVGADIRFVPARDYFRHLDTILVDEASQVKEQGGSPWVIPTGASDGYGVWGYVNCAEELKADFKAHQISPKYLFHSTGSGGTQAGLTAGMALHEIDCAVIGVNVCDDEAWFQRKVREDISHWNVLYGTSLDIDSLNIQVMDGYVGEGYAKASSDIMETITELAQQEGLILDPVYTGKAFHGMVDQIRQGRYCDTDDIVFLHTGGIFGLFAYGEQLNASF